MINDGVVAVDDFLYELSACFEWIGEGAVFCLYEVVCDSWVGVGNLLASLFCTVYASVGIGAGVIVGVVDGECDEEVVVAVGCHGNLLMRVLRWCSCEVVF